MTAGNFSQAPSDVLGKALLRNYVGLHIEQGVPVLDRDINLLGDLIAATIQQLFHRHLGDGTAGTTDFAIQTNSNPLDFAIIAGIYLCGGTPVTLAANTTYLTQPVPATALPAPPLPALTPRAASQPDPRIDTVYLDVWVEEIDETGDVDLANGTDVGMRTSTRSKVQFVVRVAENAAAAPNSPPTGHIFVPLAQISRRSSGGPSIIDKRLTQLSFAQAALRLSTLEKAFAPVITAVAPNHVLPGQTNPIIVTGRNLDLGGATVMLGNVAGSVDPSTSPTTLVVSVPASLTPGTRQLTVTTAIGTAKAPVDLIVDTPPPPPAFVATGGATQQIAPSQAATGTQLVLNGTHFTGVNRVTFNVNPPVYAVPGGDLVNVTDTAIRVNVPAALASQVGSSMSITVSIDGISSMRATSDVLFTVSSPPILTPTFGATGSQITTSPPSNPVTQSHGNQVTLHGTNFGTTATTTQVRFIGSNIVVAAASDLVSVTPTAITVRVPAGLTVPASPGNSCRVTVIVQNVESLPSDDRLFVT